MPALGKLSEEELLAENERLMEARGKAERGFKEQQSAIQRELARRAAATRLTGALQGLTPEQRRDLLAELQGQEA
jgi:hypothetical protein